MSRSRTDEPFLGLRDCFGSPDISAEATRAYARALLESESLKKASAESGLALCQQRIREYQTLQLKLKYLLERPAHTVLAPICGGVAYFEGRLVDSNNILVLLGDNFFAERSVSQTLEIVKRRLAFLAARESALQADIEASDSRVALALQSGCAASPEEEPSGECGTTGNAAATGSDDDAALAIDDPDRLTLEEIELVEAELGDDAWDEVKAEDALRRAVERKREARLRQTVSLEEPVQRRVISPAEPTAPAFATPADIGRLCATASVAQNNTVANPVPPQRLRPPAIGEIMEHKPSAVTREARQSTADRAAKPKSLFARQQLGLI